MAASGKYLLDTNILIALFGNDKSVVTKISGLEEIFIPSICLGELYYGAHNSSQIIANLSKIDDLASSISIINCDALTARYYGEIKQSLKTKGMPIPENDLWIAAIAIQHDLCLITKDHHFKAIVNLSYLLW